MNKSLATNLLSLVLIGIGYFIRDEGELVLNMGLYSFSGAVTNWLAIHMLFEKVPFLYGSGIVTERFEEFKSGIRNLIMNQFFTKENFEKFLGDHGSSILKIEEEAIIEAIDFDKIFNKLKKAIVESPFGGMLGMFGGEAALEPLRPSFEEKFKESIVEMIQDEAFLSELTKKSEGSTDLQEDVSAIVDQRLDELTPGMVKEIIQEMIREHLGWLVVWGGVFGAIIGAASYLMLPN